MDAWRDAINDLHRRAYGALLGAGLVSGVIAGAIVSSRGPLWLQIVAVTGAGLFFLATELSDHVDLSAVDIVQGLAALATVLSVITLALLPADDRGILAGLALGVTVAITAVLSGQLLHLLTGLVTKIRVGLYLVGAIGLCGLGLWRAWDPMFDHSWWAMGTAIGVAVGVCAGSMLVAVQISALTWSGAFDLYKVRRHPEKEFINTALWTRVALEDLRDDEGTVPRDEAVFYLEALAKILSRGVGPSLKRIDPESRAFVDAELAQRAQTLRQVKRRLLFGEPDAVEAAEEIVRDGLPMAAVRRWTALPVLPTSAAGAEPIRSSRRRRHVAFALLIPAGLLAVGVFANLPGLVPVAVLWAGGNALEFVSSPGIGGLRQNAATGHPHWPDISQFGRS